MSALRRTPVVALAAALLSLGAPVAGQDAAVTEGQFMFSGVSFPSIAGEFRVTQALRWEEAEAGVQLSYMPEGIAGAYNVYVYPAEGDLERETAKAIQGMIISANRVRSGSRSIPHEQ